MAHTILGIDLGAYSVKVVEIEAGFRQSQLMGMYERRLLEPESEGESERARAARTLAAVIAEHRLKPEMFATALGDEAIIRLLALPFSDPKKIEQVLGYELESQILGNVEGMVLDHVLSGSSGDVHRVIAVAAEREQVRGLITDLSAVGAEPRLVGAAALAYAALNGHAFHAEEPLAILDVGHRHTQLCVVHGSQILFARTIGRGSEEVTSAIGHTYAVEAEDAQRVKEEQAFLALPGAPPPAPPYQKLEWCTRAAVRPLLRELRQSLAAQRVGAPPPTELVVTGGGARLKGFLEHLESELGLPARRLELEPSDRLLGDGAVTDETLSGLPAQALGLALAAAAPVQQVNLRKGELAYRSDYSFLRGKARYLAVAVLAILGCAGLNAVASLRGLRKEGEALEARLKRETTELFGQPQLDGRAVSEELKGGPKGGAPPVPTLSAYDVLDEISSHVPAADKGKLDVLELDIKPRKTYLKATAESAQQVDDLDAALRQIECFEEVQKGKVSTVTAPPSGDNAKGDKPTELKQFTLTINTTCP